MLYVDVISKEDSEGWLVAIVHFQQSGFSVHFQMSLMANDLYSFRDELVCLNNYLKGTAAFQNIEHNISVLLTADNIGHIEVRGKLRDPFDIDLETTFVFESDQTFLPPLLQSVNYILQNYKSLQ